MKKSELVLATLLVLGLAYPVETLAQNGGRPRATGQPDEPAPTPPASESMPTIQEGLPEASAPALAVPPPGVLVEGAMTLEDLLNLDTTVASLTSSATALVTPATVTTITEEDIRLTPARNLLDLLEVYVPGALFMLHSEGSHPGIRGNISDRNFKFLLLVNGRILNQKAHSGVVTEIENWDLSDIAEIKVIRGPGSVTYGPGAVAGLIAITTKGSGNLVQPGRVRLTSYFPYESHGISVEQGFAEGFMEAYFNASFVTTQGAPLPTFKVETLALRSGYLGEFGESSSAYYRDFDGRPQIKAHLDLRLWKEWNLWARYTGGGASAGPGQADRFQTGLTPEGQPTLGPPITFVQMRSRQFTSVLANDHAFGEHVMLKTMLSYYSQDFRRRIQRPYTYSAMDPPEIQAAVADPTNLRYYHQRFSEDELFARLVLNVRAGEVFELAVGGAWTYNHWGPSWGDDPQYFRMGDGSNFISGTDSPAWDFPKYKGVDPNKLWVRTVGFGANTYTALGEARLSPHPLFGLLLSGRADKNDMTDVLVTPRVALTSEFGKRAGLRLIWQRAQRMNTAEQLFLENRVNNTSPDPEEVTYFEGTFTVLPRENLSFSVATWYSEGDIVGFDPNSSTSPVVGHLRLAGGEAELSFAGTRWRGGINQAFVKQIDWKLREGVTASGISYSDYDQVTRDDPDVVLKGQGNNVNNWANHATKLFVNYRPTPWLTLHLDSRVFWEYEGALDGVRALELAVVGTGSEEGVRPILDRLKEENAYGIDFRVNASARIGLSERFSLTLYGMNLAGVGGFKRYGYDAGNVRVAPSRVQIVREPLTVGATFEYVW